MSVSFFLFPSALWFVNQTFLHPCVQTNLKSKKQNCFYLPRDFFLAKNKSCEYFSPKNFSFFARGIIRSNFFGFFKNIFCKKKHFFKGPFQYDVIRVRVVWKCSIYDEKDDKWVVRTHRFYDKQWLIFKSSAIISSKQ